VAVSTPSRGHSGRFERDLDTAQRDRAAALLRAERLSYEQIAQRLGFADKSGAFKAVQRAIAEAPAEAGAAVKASEIEQLDLLAQKAFEAMRRKHPVISNGKRFDDLEDDGPVFQAINTLLRIQERRSRLEGLDAPPKSEVSSDTAIDAEIEKFLARLGQVGETPAPAESEG
jgi:AraC-like DNA-binding protein